MTTKLLEDAIGKARELPTEDQDMIAAAILSLLGEHTPVLQLDEQTRTAVLEGLAQAERHEFVPDQIVAEADEHHFRASVQELQAIDDADRGGTASEEEVEAAYRTFRPL